ncbi:unnamed protein product [Sphenostylis stenocarpa]|uniref:Uncharacterized protein n=1 Tax=Sphenostylis stenocarpa TaxID=92480 RepID=A0AA86S4V1_9FABA|nr:unnamed protein product [Sphenostylis stenocarpa]
MENLCNLSMESVVRVGPVPVDSNLCIKSTLLVLSSIGKDFKSETLELIQPAGHYVRTETGCKHVRFIWEEDGPQKSMSFIKLEELLV